MHIFLIKLLLNRKNLVIINGLRNLNKKYHFKLDANIQKTTFNQIEDIDKYYSDGNQNYQDNLPFDLFNMVEVVKRLNKISSLPAIKEYK